MKVTYLSTGNNHVLARRPIGQSLVEFALILPLFVLIIAGIFDLGRAFFTSITITNAARVGARYGTLHPSDLTGVITATVTEAQDSNIFINPMDVTVACPINVDRCAASNPITVTVNYIYDDMLFSFFFPSGIQMLRQEVMIVP